MSSQPSAADATRTLLASLWERNKPVFSERLDELDRAASLAATHSLDTKTRHAAMSTAHKLAGSLGMFGYDEGTELARKLEVMLEAPADGAPDGIDALALAELVSTLRGVLPL